MEFGGLQVIAELDLHVDEGEIVSVIGPNGAGKTTLFNLITGVYRPDAATSCSTASRSSGCRRTRSTKRGVARTFQTLRLFLNMTVKENVMAAAYGAHERGRRPLDAPHARDAARGARDRAARRGEALVLRPAADGLPLEPARLLALLREPAPAGDRARDGDRSRASSCSTSPRPG